MKTRNRLLFALFLTGLLLGITWIARLAREQESSLAWKATINRDCAPWDGSAFTISIPYESGSEIRISIWQAPDIKWPVRFILPDQNGRLGNAVILTRSGAATTLHGSILLRRVIEGIPAVGEFDFLTPGGGRIGGKFTAEWGDSLALCG
jgi:hypothetical protein